MNLVIVGSTGLVGQSLLSLLEKFNYKFSNLFLIASERSDGKKIVIKSEEYFVTTWLKFCYIYEKLEEKKTIFINCGNKKTAYLISDFLKFHDGIMIDNSNAFRMYKEVPLVVPHINFDLNKIIANPNCSSIILACLLNPLMKYKVKRIIVSTYQAVSGAGKEGIEELEKQISCYSKGEEIVSKTFPTQCFSNCFVHNSPVVFEDYNEEEMKMVNEIQKIFNQKINITCTCIRVPVLRSHCESVNIEFEKLVSKKEIIEDIKKDEFLIFDDKTDSLISSSKTHVFVGHIRKDFSQSNTYNFWISGDQILRGASFNAFKILEKLVSLYLEK